MLWEQPEGRKKGKPFQSWPVIPQVAGELGSDCLTSNMSNAADTDRSSSLYSTETFILSAKVSNLLVTRTKSVSVEWFILYARWCTSKSSCKDTLRWLAPLRQKWTDKLTWKCRKCTINLVCRLCVVGLSISVQQKDNSFGFAPYQQTAACAVMYTSTTHASLVHDITDTLLVNKTITL